MKKVLTTLMVLAVMATVASAGVGIQWQTGWGAYTHDAPNITDDPSAFALLDHYSAIWQLIYAGADNVIDPASQSAGASGIADNYVTDDDVVWAERTIATAGATAPEDGTTWNNFMYRVGAAGNPVYSDLTWATAGFVYQRVFEGTPGPETYYYNSPLFAFDGTWSESLAPIMFTAEVNMNVGGLQPNNQFPPAVPEPATMGLLGLGALVMAIRRRRS